MKAYPELVIVYQRKDVKLKDWDMSGKIRLDPHSEEFFACTASLRGYLLTLDIDGQVLR